MAEAGAPETTKAMMAEARAPGTAKANANAARLSAQEVETRAAEALAAPLVQGPTPLWESAREVEELETRSLGKLVFLRWERDVWDQLQRQKGLLAGANKLLSARSTKVEDLYLRCADAKVEVTMAQEQLAPLVARVKELEEELTRVSSDRDAFRSRAIEAMASAMALAGQLGAEQNAHQLTKGALDEALAAAEASRTEAVVWRGKAEELGSEASRVAEASWVEAQHLKEKAKAFQSEAKVTRATEASVVVQMVLETEIKEHDALKGAARAACEALVVEGVQSGSSLRSHLIALSGQVHEWLRGALHTGVKHALAIIASHYVGVDLQAISDGYVLPDDDDEADEVVTKLLEVVEGPSMALATLF
ncbi:uncharacterized protein [Miscanthus floridulus]|uniref:uncharacterized protein n=1 Tax=Miscanthus floridulus TaxID=154761 RepID=UPI00345989ED